MSPLRPHREFALSTDGNGFLTRLLAAPGTSAETSTITFTSDTLPGLTWSLLDSGHGGISWTSRGTGIVHVLHENDEPSRIAVDEREMPILPGDSLLFGSGSREVLSGGMLALQVTSEEGIRGFEHQPTHGLERFAGFNRQTTCAASQHIALDRWKLTTALDLEPHARGDALTVIFGKVSCLQAGTIVTLTAGECLVLPAGSSTCHIVPDGLAYVAVAWQPDLEREVIGPLRDAGFSDERIREIAPLP